MKTGIAFSDHITTEKIRRRRYNNNDFLDHTLRDFLMPLFLFIFLSVLIIRLFFLQVVNGSYYQLLSDKNRTRTEVVHSPRGIIFDRHGVPLVFNVPGFRETLKDKTKVLTRDEAMSLIISGKKDLEVDSLRFYPYKEALSHLLGYIGQINKEELTSSFFSNYQSGDLIGKSGIEKEYEKKLRGVDGKKLVEVDAFGRQVGILGSTDPIAGEDIKLTVDIKIQEAVYDALKDVKKGAVIVSLPTGEVLSLVSKPSFDPNLFTMGETYKATNSAYSNISSILLDSENQPFLNRAITGVYPPGSTFKLITAATGLENKILDENFSIEDTGVLKVGEFSFANWFFTQYRKTDGTVNIIKAIQRSNDIFFYKLAEMIGVDKISEMARKFGLGEKTGIDLNGEARGLVPDPAWKKNKIGESWYLGDTYHYGIGQGYLLTTPLQVNLWTQAIANNGVSYQPYLLKNQKSKIKNQKFLSQKTTDLIREGMIKSCSSGGVAWPLFEFRIPAFAKAANFTKVSMDKSAGKQNSKIEIDGKNFLKVPESTNSGELNDYVKVSIACKTGTAQHGDEKTMPHAWITLFAPAYKPEIVVTVLVESSGEGSNVAAPIAKKILEEYFKNR